MAAMPEAVSTASSPPSRRVSFFSRTGGGVRSTFVDESGLFPREHVESSSAVSKRWRRLIDWETRVAFCHSAGVCAPWMTLRVESPLAIAHAILAPSICGLPVREYAYRPPAPRTLQTYYAHGHSGATNQGDHAPPDLFPLQEARSPTVHVQTAGTSATANTERKKRVALWRSRPIIRILYAAGPAREHHRRHGVEHTICNAIWRTA